MEWLVEFEERRLPLVAVWSHDMEKLVGNLKSTIDRALAVAASPEDLDGLKIVLYADTDHIEGPTWGFKLVGPASAVDYAQRLIGNASSTRSTLN